MNDKDQLHLSLHVDLEGTRRAYHRLLATLSAEDWARVSGNPSMTVGQLMSHLAEDVGFMTRMVEWARRGRSVDPPPWLFYMLNPFRVHWGARYATLYTVGTMYDRGHNALCAALDAVGDEDWEKGATFLGRYTTVAGVFRLPVKHFAQHAMDIQLGLRRGVVNVPWPDLE